MSARRRTRAGRALARAAAAVAIAALGLLPFAGAATASAARRATVATARKRVIRPKARAVPRVTVAAALARLAQSGAIDQSSYREYLGTYGAATGSLRKLSGTRRLELGAVTGNVEAMAANGLLTPSRLPAVFLTLRRNWEWWTTRPLLGSGQRVSLQGSRLVWEHYPGQGIEIQWLATFGEANGYYLSHDTTALEQVLDEAIALATQRAGGIAWEYVFRFDGGAPPWTSGLSQGTALQALARAWSATKQARYLTAAQQALGLFQTAPPAGVRVASGAGAHYLQYTYAPQERVLNGFVQSLVGLYEYARLTGDPAGQQLFEAGDAEARAEVPLYDTGAWSMYDQRSESSLSYHELLAEFLEHLCERTREGEPLAAGAGQRAGGQSGGGSGQTPAADQIAGDEVYCTTATRLREEERTPPKVELLTSAVNASERAGVRIGLSKISTVTMTIALGERTVWTNRATVEGGKPRLLWVTPKQPGVFAVTLRATDLAGNEEVATGAIAVKRAPKPRHKAAATPRGRPKQGRAKAAAATSAATSPPARQLPPL